MDLSPCKRVVLFGGSFDPPHYGHVRLPELARQAIGADVVAYIPAAQQPLKTDRRQTPGPHRLAMLRLALADQPHTVVLTDELDRAGDGKPSYTVDTLKALRDRVGKSVDLRLLIGADNLRVFDQWRQPERIIELAEPLVMLRPPQTRVQVLSQLPAGYDAKAWASRLVELPLIDISSTRIREHVAAGRPIAGLVPPAVEAYIHEHGLYRESQPN